MHLAHAGILIALVAATGSLAALMARGAGRVPRADVAQMSFPFRNFVDRSGVRRDVVGLGAPFRSDEHRQLFYALRRQGVRIVGFTHYQTFPGKLENPHEDPYHATHPFDYAGEVDGWCYCHRDPDAVGIPREHRIDLVESDFADGYALCRMVDCGAPKRYDYVFSMPSEVGDRTAHRVEGQACGRAWQAHCRNLTLAQECLPIFCRMGLRGAVVGRDCSADVPDGCDLIDLHGDLPYSSFLQLLVSARFLFLPSIFDASPRKLTEALALGTPALVNRDIVGGFKYIGRHTGAFFSGTDDVAAGARRCLALTGVAESYARQWPAAEASARLQSFLGTLGVRTDDSVALKI